MLSDTQRRRLDAWVLATGPRAVAYAASLLRDRSRAEDVVQDCFYRLLRKADSYDLERDGTKLLFKSVSHACINENTRRKAMLSLSGATDDDRDFDPADAAAIAPDRIAATQELQRAVADGLAKLPELHRAALELRGLGHGKHDIADILGVSPSHAGVLVHRARQHLAEILAPLLGESSS